MTAAQRQARYRAAHAEGAPRLRYCRPADRRSMAQRWRAVKCFRGEIMESRSAWLRGCGGFPIQQGRPSIGDGGSAVAGDIGDKSLREMILDEV